jgi:hypothetical protein
VKATWRVLGFVAACVACGGRTQLGSETVGEVGATPPITWPIPLGSYSSCQSTIVTTRPRFTGVSGGYGMVTLSQEGDGVAATLAFRPFVTGRVVFEQTTAVAATFGIGQSLEVDMAAFGGSTATTVNATNGALLLLGETLSISVHGDAGADDVSAYVHCSVPSSARPTGIVANASAAPPLTAGVYGPCTSAVGSATGGVTGGGTGTITVAESGGHLRATWDSGLTPVCGGLDFDAASNGSSLLLAGQICSMRNPCGPPPTLGPSPSPSVVALTNTVGAMTLAGHSLFVNVVGDTTSKTCGRHYVSIICAAPAR